MPPERTLDALSTIGVFDGYSPLIDPDLGRDIDEKQIQAGSSSRKITKDTLDFVFSVHATISRDQTEQQKAIEEQSALRNVLEGPLELSLSQSHRQTAGEDEPVPESIFQSIAPSSFKPGGAKDDEEYLASQSGGSVSSAKLARPAELKQQKRLPLTESNLKSFDKPTAYYSRHSSDESSSAQSSGRLIRPSYEASDNDEEDEDINRQRTGIRSPTDEIRYEDFSRPSIIYEEASEPSYDTNIESRYPRVELSSDYIIERDSEATSWPESSSTRHTVIIETISRSEVRVSSSGYQGNTPSDTSSTSGLSDTEELSDGAMSKSSDSLRPDYVPGPPPPTDFVSTPPPPPRPAWMPSNAPPVGATRRHVRVRNGTTNQVRLPRPRVSSSLSTTSAEHGDNYRYYEEGQRPAFPRLESSPRVVAPGGTRMRPMIPDYHRPPLNSLRDDQTSPNPSQRSAINKIQELSTELEELKRQVNWDPYYGDEARSSAQEDDFAPWKLIYRICGHSYLGTPMWTHGRQDDIVLSATEPLRNISSYFEHHPGIQFCVFKDFDSDRYIETEDERPDQVDINDLRPPKASSEAILLAPYAVLAMEELTAMYPEFQIVFPDFDFSQELVAPYFVFFYIFPTWEQNASYLPESQRWIVLSLYTYLNDTVFPEYNKAFEHFEAGKVLHHHIPYLLKPGEIVVNNHPRPTAFMVSTWAVSLGRHGSRRRTYDDANSKDSSERHRMARRQSRFNRNREHGRDFDNREEFEVWTMQAWNWDCTNGTLVRKSEMLQLQFPLNIRGSTPLDINTLEWFPLRYASDEIKERLISRGMKFWRCRQRQFVGYAPSENARDLENASERVMVDHYMYRKLHPEQRRGKRDDQDDQLNILAQNEPPDDGTINLAPATLVGYNLRQKQWVDIEVDRIREVDWNKTAFESLAVDDATKHLIKALISTQQLKAEGSTDLISGKGNGLIMLLHGRWPWNRENVNSSVAEYVEKPLYRVTCGDIGTKPEDVEKYLETVLTLGKTWGCVVLLDEADVFLEERSLQNLERNALVSVFLRVLEYYDGILILTSNRVGTFDQAFKSRIQLSLHYEKLSREQRVKIWTNFFKRLQDLGEKDVDSSDLYAHVNEFAEHDMNGREIRNTITTARQLAQFDGKVLTHEQIQQVVEVSGKFENYLKNVSGGMSSDQRARDEGIR